MLDAFVSFAIACLVRNPGIVYLCYNVVRIFLVIFWIVPVVIIIIARGVERRLVSSSAVFAL